MQYHHPKSQFRIPSPPQAKRSAYHFNDMLEEPEIRERIQKLRRLDSPTSPTNVSTSQIPSPSYVSIDVNFRNSQKAEHHGKRSVSPKAIYPASIQKYMNGKCSAADAINKLKEPPSSAKAHKDQLDKMRFLGQLQTGEIEDSIISRKASSPIVSPNYSLSPIFSPKTDNSFREESVSVMGLENPRQGGVIGGFEGNQTFNSRWKHMNDNNRSSVSVTTNGSMMTQATQEAGSFTFPNYANESNQFQQKNQSNSCFNGGHHGQFFQPEAATSTIEEDEPRERTNSFIGSWNFPQLQFLNNPNPGVQMQSMVENQINAIRTLVQHKRTTSPVDHNRTLMQFFQKRNSNPENLIRDPQGLFAEQQCQYPNQMQHHLQRQQQQQHQQQSNFQGFEQKPVEVVDQSNQHQHQQQQEQQQEQLQYQQGFIFNQMEAVQPVHQNHQVLNNQEQQQQGVNTEFVQENLSMEHCGFDFPNEIPQHQAHPGSYVGSFRSDILDPDAFLNNELDDNADFDMNIIHSDSNFVHKSDMLQFQEFNGIEPYPYRFSDA